MSAEPETWQPIPPYERRMLGVLIEKQKTSKSADAYPMTLNSIVSGCNQKSNRDPVYELDDLEVEETLDALQKKGIVVKMTGSRVDRWRHQLYELWRVTKVEMAILAELLMRGPQSEGDLRGRASRMDEIADLDALREHLKSLTARGLVVYLTAAERRGAMLTHGFHTPDELDAARRIAPTGGNDPAPRVSAANDAKWQLVLDELAELRERIAKLEAKAVP